MRATNSDVVTLADVARAAGTSVATVSYVLNSGPRNVAPASRQRVLEAIRQLGYRPNRIAQALRSRQSHLIGLVVPGTADPFFTELAHAVEVAAYDAGYLTVVGNSAFDPDRELALVEAFIDTQVDGLVFVGLGESRNIHALVTSASQRCVSIHNRPLGMPGPFVTIDNVAAARLATRHLLGHGHETVACLAHHDDLGPAGERVLGWRQTLRKQRIGPRQHVLVRSPIDRRSSSDVCVEWLRKQSDVTAVLAVTDELAIGLLHAAARIGRRVPDDLAVISIDGIPETATTVPELTTIAEPFTDLGRRAIELLLDPNAESATSIHASQLLARQSCGCGR